ncbi:MAG: phosphate ABC transporter, permease protein PstA, partial [Saprospiraceae bacterium]|nr:phosphate ABC transporter, permease protein PstA [Saprospiraceae bacterium]
MKKIDEEKLTRVKKRNQAIAFWIFRVLGFSVVAILFVILGFIVTKGLGVISWDFVSKMPEEGMTKGGVYPAIIGTMYLVFGSMLFAFPIGVMAAIYMNEYVKNGIIKSFIKQMTNNLAGIPSIVFGLFGMSL